MMQPSASELGELEGRKPTLSCRWWNVRFAAIHRTIRAKRLFHMWCLSDRIRWHHAAVLLFGLIVAGCSTQEAAADRSAQRDAELAARLPGVWRYLKEVDTRSDGSTINVPGPQYAGFIIYTPDGFVAANVMPKARTWSSGSATIDELRESTVVGATTAYAGRYEVDPKTRTVAHLVSVSVDPGDEGHRLARMYAFEGDVLLLSGDFIYNSEKLRFTVYWERAGKGN